MKLIIEEQQRKLDYRTGKQKVIKTAKRKEKCVIGKTIAFEKGERCFVIKEVTEKSVSFTVLYSEERYNKEWKLKKGERTIYRPIAADGGYQYYFKAK